MRWIVVASLASAIPLWWPNALSPPADVWSGPQHRLTDEGHILFTGDLNGDSRSDFISVQQTAKGAELSVLLQGSAGPTKPFQTRNVVDDLAAVATTAGLLAELVYVDGIHTTTLLGTRALMVVFTVRESPSPPFFFLVYAVDDDGRLEPQLSSVRFMAATATRAAQCETFGTLRPGASWIGVASSSYPFLVDPTATGVDILLLTFTSGLNVVSFGDGGVVECGAFASRFPLAAEGVRRLSWWNPATWFSGGAKNRPNAYESTPLVQSVRNPRKVRHFGLSLPEPRDVPLTKYSLPRHHSSALVDLNGDCHADLALEVQTSSGREIHIYLSRPHGFERQPPAIPLPDGAHYVTWADIDADGAMDYVFAVCDTSEPPLSGVAAVPASLYKEFHQCAGNSRIVWSQARGLADAAGPVAQTWLSWLIRIRDAFGGGTTATPCREHAVAFSPLMAVELHKSAPNFANIGLPLRLMAADLDLSGYPDLLFPVVDSQGVPFFGVYANVPGSIENAEEGVRLPPTPRSFTLKRTFSLTDGVDSSSRAEAVGSLVESGEPGGWSLVLSHPRMKLSPQVYTREAAAEGFFVRPILRSRANFEPRGATTQIIFTDINGIARRRLTVSGSQTVPGGSSPDVTIGLGRLSSYIDFVSVGLPSGTLTRSWANLIPNTKFVLRVNAPADLETWTIHWSVPPLRLFWPVILITTAALVAVGVLLRISDRKKVLMRERLDIRSHFIV